MRVCTGHGICSFGHCLVRGRTLLSSRKQGEEENVEAEALIRAQSHAQG